MFSYISGNENPEKKFLIFQETELFYILGNGHPKKLLVFQKLTFQAHVFIFQEMEISGLQKLSTLNKTP